MSNKFITLLVCVGMIIVAGCQTTGLPDTSKLYAKETASQIYTAGRQDLLKSRFEEAASRFEVIESRYPFGEYARQAQLNLIYVYYQQSDNLSALAAAEQYLRLYPRGPHADYAYYMQGLAEMNINHGFFERFFKADLAQRDLSGIKKAFHHFDRVVRWYPNSPYASDARRQMVTIRNRIAQHAIEVAQYYFDKEAYVAANNRAAEVVRYYPNTPSACGALILIYKASEKLGLLQNAQEAKKVLQLNYPNIKVES